MNSFLKKVRQFSSRNRVQIITIAIIIALTSLGAAISIYQSYRFSYDAVRACDLLTESEAKHLLGEKVIGIFTGEPTTENNVATSKCSYSDTNPNSQAMKVAAIGVLSPRNSNGVTDIKTDYDTAKSGSEIQPVREIGDDAFFDKSAGQLNVLYKNIWLKFNYGAGEVIDQSSVDDMLNFAKDILAQYDKQYF